MLKQTQMPLSADASDMAIFLTNVYNTKVLISSKLFGTEIENLIMVF